MNTHTCLYNENNSIKQNISQEQEQKEEEKEYDCFYWYELGQELVNWSKKYNKLRNKLKTNDDLKKMCNDFNTKLIQLKKDYRELVDKVEKLQELESVLPDCECDSCDKTRWF